MLALHDMENEALLNQTNEGEISQSTKINKASIYGCFVVVEDLSFHKTKLSIKRQSFLP